MLRGLLGRTNDWTFTLMITCCREREFQHDYESRVRAELIIRLHWSAILTRLQSLSTDTDRSREHSWGE